MAARGTVTCDRLPPGNACQGCSKAQVLSSHCQTGGYTTWGQPELWVCMLVRSILLCLGAVCGTCADMQALIYMDMGNLTEAYEKAQAALTMRQKVLSSDHPDLAHSLAGKQWLHVLMLLPQPLQRAPCLIARKP